MQCRLSGAGPASPASARPTWSGAGTASPASARPILAACLACAYWRLLSKRDAFALVVMAACLACAYWRLLSKRDAFAWVVMAACLACAYWRLLSKRAFRPVGVSKARTEQPLCASSGLCLVSMFQETLSIWWSSSAYLHMVQTLTRD